MKYSEKLKLNFMFDSVIIIIPIGKKWPMNKIIIMVISYWKNYNNMWLKNYTAVVYKLCKIMF